MEEEEEPHEEEPDPHNVGLLQQGMIDMATSVTDRMKRARNVMSNTVESIVEQGSVQGIFLQGVTGAAKPPSPTPTPGVPRGPETSTSKFERPIKKESE